MNIHGLERALSGAGWLPECGSRFRQCRNCGVRYTVNKTESTASDINAVLSKFFARDNLTGF